MSEYSFEHGIDDCGQEGVTPILYVGHSITERDFVERDLSGIRGVSVSQRGLKAGTSWTDLNLGFLFERLGRGQIEYLRLRCEKGSIDFDAIGELPALNYLEIDSPKVRGTLRGLMPHLEVAFLRWPDTCTASLDAPSLRRLELIRPRSEDLSLIGHLTALTEVRVLLGRALCSISGIEQLGSLATLTLSDCPNFIDLRHQAPMPGPVHLAIFGCKRFADAAGAEQLPALKSLGVCRADGGPKEVLVPAQLKSRGVVLDLKGVTSVWSP